MSAGDAGRTARPTERHRERRDAGKSDGRRSSVAARAAPAADRGRHEGGSLGTWTTLATVFGGFGLGIGAWSLVTLGGHGRLRVEQLEIVDRDGETVLVLSASRKFGHLRVLSSAGEDLLSIGEDPNNGGGLLRLNDALGQGVCVMNARSEPGGSSQYGSVRVWDYGADITRCLEAR